MPRQQPKAKAPRKSDIQEMLGVETLSRIDPDEDFSDVDGDPRSDFALADEASDRHPVWVRNHPDDIGDYKSGNVPFRIETATKDGVRVLKDGGQYTEGEPIVKKGHVLMTCDKALWQKRNRLDLKRTHETNNLMFKRKQRDLDLRREGALEAERAEMR